MKAFSVGEDSDRKQKIVQIFPRKEIGPTMNLVSKYFFRSDILRGGIRIGFSDEECFEYKD